MGVGGLGVGAVGVLSGDHQGVLWGLVGCRGDWSGWCNLVQLGATGFGLVMGWGVCGVCAGWLFTGWVGDIWWDRVVCGAEWKRVWIEWIEWCL